MPNIGAVTALGSRPVIPQVDSIGIILYPPFHHHFIIFEKRIMKILIIKIIFVAFLLKIDIFFEKILKKSNKMAQKSSKSDKHWSFYALYHFMPKEALEMIVIIAMIMNDTHLPPHRPWNPPELFGKADAKALQYLFPPSVIRIRPSNRVREQFGNRKMKILIL